MMSALTDRIIARAIDRRFSMGDKDQEIETLRRTASNERAARANAEEQRDIALESLRAAYARIAVLERIG